MRDKHPSVLAATLTFCIGLLIVRSILLLMSRHKGIGALGWFTFDPLLTLVFICAGATALYMIIRRDEGDFHALFVVNLGMFFAGEGVHFLATELGMGQFSEIALLLSFTVCVYGVLTLIASVYDLPLRTEPPFRKAKLISTMGMIALTSMRALGATFAGGSGPYKDIVGLFVLGLIIVYLGFALSRKSTEQVSSQFTADRKPGEHAGDL